MDSTTANQNETPPATDYQVGPTLSTLTGLDLVLKGQKKSGEVYERVLDNCSIKPVKDGLMVIGLDPEKQQVRQFDLALVAELRVVGGQVFKKSDILAMLDEAVRTLKQVA